MNTLEFDREVISIHVRCIKSVQLMSRTDYRERVKDRCSYYSVGLPRWHWW